MTNRTQKILLIEDDPAVAESLRDALRQEGYQVSWTAYGVEGIRLTQAENPHLILLDIRLPDISGFDVARQMRQMDMRQPILMLTARQDEMDKVLGLELGADDYITKPFSLRELLSRIRAMLRRAYGELSSAQGDTLFVADLVIDQTRGQVRRGEQIILLTPTEFRLLVYLARHTGQALSRAQIVDAVWGYSPDVESEKAVNVHIRRLREKVEPDPANPSLILTVPGVGYRLVA